MEERLVSLIEKVWDVIWQGTQAVISDNHQVKYNKESEKDFRKTFVSVYEKIAENYMTNKNEPLDRHKVAAITIVSIIRAKVLVCDKVRETDVFMGNYMLATDVALTYMLSEMNKRLIGKGEKALFGYVFPEAMACETDYYKIFYRNLYFADCDEEWELNPLDIAERLFLLEYITLEKNNIEPSVLKEYDAK